MQTQQRNKTTNQADRPNRTGWVGGWVGVQVASELTLLSPSQSMRSPVCLSGWVSE